MLAGSKSFNVFIFFIVSVFYDNVATAVDNLAVKVTSYLKHLDRLEFSHVTAQLSKFFLSFLSW